MKVAIHDRPPWSRRNTMRRTEGPKSSSGSGTIRVANVGRMIMVPSATVRRPTAGFRPSKATGCRHHLIGNAIHHGNRS